MLIMESRWFQLRKYKLKWRYDRRSGNCMQFKQHVCISAYLNLSMLFIITKPVELEPNVKFFFFLGGGGGGGGVRVVVKVSLCWFYNLRCQANNWDLNVQTTKYGHLFSPSSLHRSNLQVDYKRVVESLKILGKLICVTF